VKLKLLSDILYKTRLEEIIGSTNVAISSVTFDSRKVKKDSLFIATRGTASDGHHYIELAIESGAVAIVCEDLPETLKENVTYVKVLDSSASLGYIACNFYDNPSREIKISW
jgi:UDP-N-acetylmuramoyl-L-alanyl-D-glutamate--2,6-diaminopimelate ligase